MLKNGDVYDLRNQFNTTDSFCRISWLCLVFNRLNFSCGLTHMNLNCRGKGNPWSAVLYPAGGSGPVVFPARTTTILSVQWLMAGKPHTVYLIHPSEHLALQVVLQMSKQLFFRNLALFQWRACIIFNLAPLWYNYNCSIYSLGYIKCIFLSRKSWSWCFWVTLGVSLQLCNPEHCCSLCHLY